MMKPGLLARPIVCALAVLVADRAGALDQDLLRFVAAKESQARDLAKTQSEKVPSIVWSFFDAVRVDDWETATNLAARLSRASGQIESTGAREPLSPGLQRVWPPIQETFGAYGQFHSWNNGWLHRFGREIIDSIPKGSVYFGGSTPGHCIISALSESHRDDQPLFSLTQNVLVDSAYRDYVQMIYGDKIHIPDARDVADAFDEYLADAGRRREAGRLRPGESVEVVDGKIKVSGPAVIKAIDARLAWILFQKNPDRDFYVEESFPIDWMYPYLSPHGLIFEINRKPLTELRVDVVEKDQDFWKRILADAIGDWLTDKSSVKEICDFGERVYAHKDLSGFKGDAGFAANEDSQKCFSRLRCNIARIYVWRAGLARENDERNRMRQAADLAYRQSLALHPYLPEAVFGYVQFLENLKRHDDATRVAETLLRHEPDNASAQRLVRQLRKAD